MQDLDQRLSAIRHRDSTASRAPWRIEQGPDSSSFIRTAEASGRDLLNVTLDSDPARPGDLKFIVMGRNIIPRLITAIETRNLDLVSDTDLSEIESVAASTFPGP